MDAVALIIIGLIGLCTVMGLVVIAFVVVAPYLKAGRRAGDEVGRTGMRYRTPQQRR